MGRLLVLRTSSCSCLFLVVTCLLTESKVTKPKCQLVKRQGVSHRSWVYFRGLTVPGQWQAHVSKKRLPQKLGTRAYKGPSDRRLSPTASWLMWRLLSGGCPSDGRGCSSQAGMALSWSVCPAGRGRQGLQARCLTPGGCVMDGLLLNKHRCRARQSEACSLPSLLCLKWFILAVQGLCTCLWTFGESPCHLEYPV